eukprot:2652869-Amphidinium_carterae.2
MRKSGSKERRQAVERVRGGSCTKTCRAAGPRPPKHGRSPRRHVMQSSAAQFTAVEVLDTQGCQLICPSCEGWMDERASSAVDNRLQCAYCWLE